MKRTLFALLLSAATTTLMWLVFVATLSAPIPSPQAYAETSGIFWLFVLFAVFLFGLPAHWLLKRLALRQWWSYVLASCVLSGGALWALSDFPSPLSAWAFFVGFWLPCVASASFGALAFWCVGVRQTPVSSAIRAGQD